MRIPYLSIECKNLSSIPHTSDTIFTESNSFLNKSIFYTFLICIECCFSALEFEKDNLPKISLWESVKNNIVYPFSDKYHIFRRIGKIRKCRKNFLIDFARDTIAWATNSIALQYFPLPEKKNFREKKSEKEPKNNSDNDILYFHENVLLTTISCFTNLLFSILSSHL